MKTIIKTWDILIVLPNEIYRYENTELNMYNDANFAITWY